MTLEADYSERLDQVLHPIAEGLQIYLTDLLKHEERIDRIQTRAKSFNRFIDKANKKESGVKKYDDPINQIQDQIGARIICFYLSDVERISHEIDKYFRPVETRKVVPERESEFGYFGKHYVLLMPTDIISDSWKKRLIPDFFELQIKTLFQHAWSEADHDLGYKPGSTELTADQKRRIAFTAAQAWGADRLFNELFHERSASPSGD